MIVPVGTHDSAEVRQAWLSAEADRAYPSNARICLDVRGSGSLARRPMADLRATADWFIGRADRAGRCCAVVARPGAQYGLMRMASTWLDFKGIDAFVATTLEEAVAWLEAHA